MGEPAIFSRKEPGEFGMSEKTSSKSYIRRTASFKQLTESLLDIIVWREERMNEVAQSSGEGEALSSFDASRKIDAIAAEGLGRWWELERYLKKRAEHYWNEIHNPRTRNRAGRFS
jgi:hypothetical protein